MKSELFCVGLLILTLVVLPGNGWLFGSSGGGRRGAPRDPSIPHHDGQRDFAFHDLYNTPVVHAERVQWLMSEGSGQTCSGVLITDANGMLITDGTLKNVNGICYL